MVKKLKKEVYVEEISGEIPLGCEDNKMKFIASTIRTLDEDNLEDRFYVSYEFAKDLQIGQKLKITIEKG